MSRRSACRTNVALQTFTDVRLLVVDILDNQRIGGFHQFWAQFRYGFPEAVFLVLTTRTSRVDDYHVFRRPCRDPSDVQFLANSLELTSVHRRNQPGPAVLVTGCRDPLNRVVLRMAQTNRMRARNPGHPRRRVLRMREYPIYGCSLQPIECAD